MACPTIVQRWRIGADDSIFIFVEVTVDPEQPEHAFAVTDSSLRFNGNLQDIDLRVWGQMFCFPQSCRPALPLFFLDCNDTEQR